jgi:hypothetical protein
MVRGEQGQREKRRRKKKGASHIWQPVFFHSISWEYLHQDEATAQRQRAEQSGSLARIAQQRNGCLQSVVGTLS